MEFESEVGVFSPDGRLIQVEYAQNASSQGGLAVIGIQADDVFVIYETSVTNSLLIPESRIKIIDEDCGIYMIFSGLKPDGCLVVDAARSICRNHKYLTGGNISIEELAREVGLFKQEYTVSTVYRPLGLRSVLIGFDSDQNPALYVIETDGNYVRYDECLAVGKKSSAVLEHLENNKDDPNRLINSFFKVAQRDLQLISACRLSRGNITWIDEKDLRTLAES
jgi:20S proteasome subunit alpha 4